MDHGQDVEQQREAFRLQIDVATVFEPQTSIHTKNSSNLDSPSGPTAHAPEKKLTLFALRLAVLEKAATGLGTLSFIWATVVLLGGFAITLSKTDFWFITIILLIEGTRIFSRSHELEWQHQATWSIVGINSFRIIRSSSHFIVKTIKGICFRPFNVVQQQSQHNKREINKSMPLEKSQRNWDLKKLPTRTWTTSDVPILPFSKWVFQSKNVSKVLYWLQLASGAMESISSLLQNHRAPRIAADEIPKIIDFTHAGQRLLKDENVTPSQILTVKRSLQVLKMLASTAGTTGKQLRNEISVWQW